MCEHCVHGLIHAYACIIFLDHCNSHVMVARQANEPACRSKYELVFVHVTQKFHRPCQAEILFTSRDVLPRTHSSNNAAVTGLWISYILLAGSLSADPHVQKCQGTRQQQIIHQ